MKNKKEAQGRPGWKPEKWVWYQILALMLAICLYAIACYPVYAWLKTGTMKRLYSALEEMKLSDLDDDDIETLDEFQKEKLEIMVTNDQFEQIYTSRSAVMSDYIQRHIQNRLDEYTENAQVEQKNLGLRHVLILKGKIEQNGHTFLCIY